MRLMSSEEPAQGPTTAESQASGTKKPATAYR